jgi:hypothetical protein
MTENEATETTPTAELEMSALNSLVMCEPTDYGVFVAKKQGICIKISVPGTTSNEWKNDNEFLDLPLMDKETFDNFVETIGKFKEILKDT